MQRNARETHTTYASGLRPPRHKYARTILIIQTQCCVLLQLYNAVVHTVHSITVLVLYLQSTSKGIFVVYMANTTVCLPHHHDKCQTMANYSITCKNQRQSLQSNLHRRVHMTLSTYQLALFRSLSDYTKYISCTKYHVLISVPCCLAAERNESS